MGVTFEKAQQAKALLLEIVRERKACMRDITGRYNYPFLIEIRREFCLRAYALGIGSVTIGKVLDRDHTTVLYHISPAMRLAKSQRRRRSNG